MPPSPNRQDSTHRNGQVVPARFDVMRWLILFVAITFISVAMVMHLRPTLLPRDTAMLSDVLGKVGLVFACAWLAWPALIALWQSPGRLTFLLAFGAAFVLFLFQRRTILITGPFLLLGAFLAILMGWVRNRQK